MYFLNPTTKNEPNKKPENLLVNKRKANAKVEKRELGQVHEALQIARCFSRIDSIGT